MGEQLPRQRISPTHFNRNLFCAIDTETTGLDYTKHEVIQLAIIPLGPDFMPSRFFKTFDVKIRPERDVDPSLGGRLRQNVVDAKLHGLERWSAVTYFEHWYASLKMSPSKKIVPLGANYPFDRDFIREWLGGPMNYDQYFRGDFRDVQSAALHINDLADWSNEPIPYPKVNLTYLCSCLKIEIMGRHTALHDAYLTMQVYRAMMNNRPPYVSIPSDKANDLAIPSEVVTSDSRCEEPSTLLDAVDKLDKQPNSP